jgi:hypothetical protein
VYAKDKNLFSFVKGSQQTIGLITHRFKSSSKFPEHSPISLELGRYWNTTTGTTQSIKAYATDKIYNIAQFVR